MVWNDHVTDFDQLAARLADAEVLILFRERTPIRGELLDRLPRLKLIAMRGVYPYVDVAACTRRGILFCSNTRAEGASIGTAELTFALVLAAARQLPQQMAWGYGRIGRQVASYARAFGMRVVWWGSQAGRARAAADGDTVASSREALFAESDVVSLHVRLVPAARGLVRREDLLRMKPTAIFVNTARAALVEPGALLDVLAAGRPGRVAVDVFEHEPLTDPTDPLINHPNVIATPHIGSVTEEDLDQQVADVYELV
jgi:D-3-phosphoglycerate dehydrogenase